MALGRFAARPVLILALAAVIGYDATGGSSAVAAGLDVAGEWQSGASSYRITTSGAKVKAQFQAVGPEGEALGFKSGDLSFEGTRTGNCIQGEQVIRYPASVPCYPKKARRVPFMAMILSDGRRIVIDWYNPSLNFQTCQHVDRSLGVTVLDRRGG